MMSALVVIFAMGGDAVGWSLFLWEGKVRYHYNLGMDCVSPVCNDYDQKGLFPFTGTIKSVIFEFGDSPQPAGMERLEMAIKMD